MASTINADVTNGLVLTPDTSGEINLQAGGVTKMSVTSSGVDGSNLTNIPAANLTGSLPALDGSALTGIATGAGTLEAWVNFNGQGTPAIRSSANVSSITDNANSNYTINFTTALASADYCALVSMTASSAAYTRGSGIVNLGYYNTNSLTTSGFSMTLEDRNGGASGDSLVVCAGAFL